MRFGCCVIIVIDTVHFITRYGLRGVEATLCVAAMSFVVSSNSGKCLVTAFDVRPGRDANCLFLIAATHVGLVGNPAAAW